jgi:hypothetical protein
LNKKFGGIEKLLLLLHRSFVNVVDFLDFFSFYIETGKLVSMCRKVRTYRDDWVTTFDVIFAQGAHICGYCGVASLSRFEFFSQFFSKKLEMTTPRGERERER